jgi:hypothetical protein
MLLCHKKEDTLEKSLQYVTRIILLIVLVMPLMANQSCSNALKKAEEDSVETTTTTGIKEDKMPVLPEGEEGEDILKSGGPEVISAPPPAE